MMQIKDGRTVIPYIPPRCPLGNESIREKKMKEKQKLFKPIKE